MAKVCCNHPIGNYRRCENDDFIMHSNSTMQCSKCGYFFKGKEVTKYNFAKEYSREKQENRLKQKITATRAGLIATLYPQYVIADCVELHFATNVWADIYLTEQGNPIVAYYLSFMDWYKNIDDIVIPKGDILLISEELPTFGPLGGTSTYSVPVQNPEKLVYTGSTVGGITTGGFHTQSGGVHYEYVSFDRQQEGKFSAGRFGDNLIQFKFSPDRLVVYKRENLPSRWEKRGQTVDKGLSFSYFDDNEFKEMIFGTALSDEDYYTKACSLMENTTYESQQEAMKMFAQLGEYKDSLFRKGTCESKAEDLHKEKIGKENTAGYIGIAIFFLLFFLIVWFLS